MTKIAINGYGRIGRNIVRVLRDRGHENLELVAVNDLADPEDLFWLTQYDTILGRYPGELERTEKGFRIDGRDVAFFQEADPTKLPWGSSAWTWSSSAPASSRPAPRRRPTSTRGPR